ncbi:polysaccharide pyruvyl transferase family protein, partial [Romboutsia sp.]|uniref:polysaccharide pyruvyl transferase family protein n=1 Tax=Romboutsia sp. TaxID=1965302 RepID=UPI002C3B8035
MYLSNNNIDKLKNYKNIKKILYMLIPIHGNLGDNAIVYSTIKYLENHFEDYQIICVNFIDTYNCEKGLREIIHEDDIIVLHGGGNMGNLYIWEEQARRYIVENFKNIPIISFPQTIYFSDDKQGKEQLRISTEIYNSHKRLTIMAREDKSFEIMKANFTECNIIKCPDIVFYLIDKLEKYYSPGINTKRENIMTCFRSDKETYYNLNYKKDIIEELKKKYTVVESDTIIQKKVTLSNREIELFKLWESFHKAKVVITDR